MQSIKIILFCSAIIILLSIPIEVIKALLKVYVNVTMPSEYNGIQGFIVFVIAIIITRKQINNGFFK